MLLHSGAGKYCASTDLCVYDPITAGSRFLPSPPSVTTRREDVTCAYDPTIKGIRCIYDPTANQTRLFHRHDFHYHKFVLLTSADDTSFGSFLLLAADFSGGTTDFSSLTSVTVRTFSSDDGAWSPATSLTQSPPTKHIDKHPIDDAVVVSGGFIYWLMRNSSNYYIFSYNVLTAKAGRIELPPEVSRGYRSPHLASCSTATGGRLSLLAAEKLMLSVWLLLPGCTDWERHAVNDVGNVPVMTPPYHAGCLTGVVFDSSASGVRTPAVLLHPVGLFSSPQSERDEK